MRSKKQLAILAALAVCVAPIAAEAAVLYWDANGATNGSGGTGNWDTASAIWRTGPGNTGSLTTWSNSNMPNDAILAGIVGTLTLTAPITVGNITAAPTTPNTYTVAGSSILTLGNNTQTAIRVETGSTLAMNAALQTTSGLTKTGGGTLILDSVPSATQGILIDGHVVVAEGTLQLGSTTNNAANQTLRAAALHLAAGASLTSSGALLDMRMGSLNGSGSITTGAGNVGVLVLRDATFSGVISTINGMNLRGANGTKQTFNGDIAGIVGTIGVLGEVTMVVTGTGSNSVIGPSTGVAIRGGTFILDNADGNTSAAAGRISETANIAHVGGNFIMVGAPTGTTEGLGAGLVGGGHNNIQVIHNGGSNGTELSYQSFTRTGAQRATVNFSGAGGTLGAAGANPRIILTGQAAGAIGEWAIYNNTDYAAYHSTNGVIAATHTALNDIGGTAGSASGVYVLNASGATSKSGASAFSAMGLKLHPNAAGLTLTISGTGNLNTSGLLLAGSHDFTIAGSSTGGITGTATRYVGVIQAATTLHVSANFRSPGQDIVKYGDGFLSVSADNSGTLNSSHTQWIINNGTLRATVGTNGAIPLNVNNSVSFRGGVLEIVNGADGAGSAADFTRTVASTSTTPTLPSVSWANSTSDRGSGGFSAFNSNASVNLGGSATPSMLTWASTNFVQDGYALVFGSSKANARITLLNRLALDDGATTNYYNAREIRVLDNVNSQNDFARITGIISGSHLSDLLKTGAGILELSAANTYRGSTIIHSGTLRLTGSFAHSPIINIMGGTLDTTGLSNFTIGSGQTLKGGGSLAAASGTTSITGRLQLGQAHGATTAIGGAAGTINISGGGNAVVSLDALANAYFDLFTAGTLAASDKVVVTGPSLAYGGTLHVANVSGATLAAGNSWKLFDATRNGSTVFANHNVFGTNGANSALPTLGNDLRWAFDYTTGVLSVESASVLEAAQLSLQHANGSTRSPGDVIAVSNAAANSPNTRDTANLSGLMITQGLHGTWSTTLTNGTIQAGTSRSGTLSFNPGNTLNGAVATGTLSFQLAGTNLAATGTAGTVTYQLQTTVTGNTATADRTNNAGAFGTAQSATIQAGGSYAGLSSTTTPASGGGLSQVVGTTATIHEGTNLTGQANAVSMAWRARTTDESDLLLPTQKLYSDVVQVTGLHGQLFVLSMSYRDANNDGFEDIYGAAVSDLKLGWLDGEWKLAVLGNMGQNNIRHAGDISWLAAVHGSGVAGLDALDLGLYGIDTSTHTVWAVLNHNSQFAVIPEPASLGVLGLGATLLLARRRRR